MAVGITVDTLLEFAQSFQDEGEKGHFYEQLSVAKNRELMLRRLTDTIISKWYAGVENDYRNHPLSEEELKEAGNYEDVYRSGKKIEHVYGTTLIGALWMPEYLILVQQGDGTCQVFYENGTAGCPIPKDDRCEQNITTSMCSEDVVQGIRSCAIDLRKNMVRACYLGSDGVEDSYRDEEGLENFYRQLLCRLLENGREGFEDFLFKEMPFLTKNGSGDDVSIAGIVNLSGLSRYLDLHQFYGKIKLYSLKAEYKDCCEALISMERKHERLLGNWNRVKAEIEHFDKKEIQLNIQEKEIYPKLGRMIDSFGKIERQGMETSKKSWITLSPKAKGRETQEKGSQNQKKEQARDDIYKQCLQVVRLIEDRKENEKKRNAGYGKRENAQAEYEEYDAEYKKKQRKKEELERCLERNPAIGDGK